LLPSRRSRSPRSRTTSTTRLGFDRASGEGARTPSPSLGAGNGQDRRQQSQQAYHIRWRSDKTASGAAAIIGAPAMADLAIGTDRQSLDQTAVSGLQSTASRQHRRPKHLD